MVPCILNAYVNYHVSRVFSCLRVLNTAGGLCYTEVGKCSEKEQKLVSNKVERHTSAKSTNLPETSRESLSMEVFPAWHNSALFQSHHF